jgi:hypothetical protein
VIDDSAGQHFKDNFLDPSSIPLTWVHVPHARGRKKSKHSNFKLALESSFKIVIVELRLRPEFLPRCVPEGPSTLPGVRVHPGREVQARAEFSAQRPRVSGGVRGARGSLGPRPIRAPVGRPAPHRSQLGRKLHAAEMNLPSPLQSFLLRWQKT